MELTLYRKRFSRWGTTGVLWIGDERICNTVEHPKWMLPPGKYELMLKPNHKAGVSCLKFKDYRKTWIVPAAGPYGFKDTCSIGIGKEILTAVLTDGYAMAYDLYDRLRKARGKIWLEIV